VEGGVVLDHLAGSGGGRGMGGLRKQRRGCRASWGGDITAGEAASHARTLADGGATTAPLQSPAYSRRVTNSHKSPY
jgi:hypothetical protein